MKTKPNNQKSITFFKSSKSLISKYHAVQKTRSHEHLDLLEDVLVTGMHHCNNGENLTGFELFNKKGNHWI